MTVMRLAMIVNRMYERDENGQQRKWSQDAGQLAFWLEEDDDEVFSVYEYLVND